MKKQYDFGERKTPKKQIQESYEVVNNIREYDFGDSINEMWMNVAKAGNAIARQGYIRNVASGAGMGAAIGGVGGVAKNMMKSDDDPTKKGIIRSFAGGATKGAAVGGMAGGAARFATGRTWGKSLLNTANAKAVNQHAMTAANDAKVLGKSAADITNAYHNAAEKAATELGNVYQKTGADAGKLTTNLGASINKFKSNIQGTAQLPVA